MAIDGAIGTAGSSEQSASNVYIGTAGSGAQDSIRGYIGTAGSGNQECFLHLPGQAASLVVQAGAGDPTTEVDATWLHHATYDTAATWEIERAPDDSGSAGVWATIEAAWGSLSYTDTGLTPGATYWYRVSGTNYQGTGALSAERSVTLDP